MGLDRSMVLLLVILGAAIFNQTSNAAEFEIQFKEFEYTDTFGDGGTKCRSRCNFKLNYTVSKQLSVLTSKQSRKISVSSDNTGIRSEYRFVLDDTLYFNADDNDEIAIRVQVILTDGKVFADLSKNVNIAGDIYVTLKVSDKEILSKIKKIPCTEQDDITGHFTCDGNGNKICLPGWQDEKTNCTTVQCPNLNRALRVDCGHSHIKEDECNNNGCCWSPLEDGSKEPWCYYKNKTAEKASSSTANPTLLSSTQIPSTIQTSSQLVWSTSTTATMVKFSSSEETFSTSTPPLFTESSWQSLTASSRKVNAISSSANFNTKISTSNILSSNAVMSTVAISSSSLEISSSNRESKISTSNTVQATKSLSIIPSYSTVMANYSSTTIKTPLTIHATSIDSTKSVTIQSNLLSTVDILITSLSSMESTFSPSFTIINKNNTSVFNSSISEPKHTSKLLTTKLFSSSERYGKVTMIETSLIHPTPSTTHSSYKTTEHKTKKISVYQKTSTKVSTENIKKSTGKSSSKHMRKSTTTTVTVLSVTPVIEIPSSSVKAPIHVAGSSSNFFQKNYLLIIIVLASAFFIILLLIMCLCCQRRRAKKKAKEQELQIEKLGTIIELTKQKESSVRNRTFSNIVLGRNAFKRHSKNKELMEMEGAEFFGFKNELFAPDQEPYDEINMEVNMTKSSRRPSIGPVSNDASIEQRMSFKFQKRRQSSIDEQAFPSPPFELLNPIQEKEQQPMVNSTFKNSNTGQSALPTQSTQLPPPPPPPPPAVPSEPSGSISDTIKAAKLRKTSENREPAVITKSSSIGSLLDEFKSKVKHDDGDDTKLVRASTLSFPSKEKQENDPNNSATLQHSSSQDRDRNFNRLKTKPKPKRNDTPNIGTYHFKDSSFLENEENEFTGFHNKSFSP